MEIPTVSARPRVSEGCTSSTSLLVSDELSIFLKSAGLRRFFMALALLVLFLPSPPAEAGATACPIGERLFNGSCYDCQDDYVPDISFDPPDNGACILKTTARFAGAYHNCDILAGEWDGLDGFCYKPCTGGYVRSGNSCVLTSRTGQAMEECGTRSRTCTTNPKGFCPLVSAAACDFAASIGVSPWVAVTTCTPYSYLGCGSEDIFTPGREGPIGDKFYSCPEGTTTEAGTYDDPNKCTITSTDTYSSRDKKIGCAAGTFQGGISSSCFKCDIGFTRESALLPEISGACYKTSSASIVTPKKAKETCVRPFPVSDQGNCDNGLLCTAGPGASECRNVPARVGEVCGVADVCDGNNYCLNQRCVARQVTGGSCTGVGQGTCKANLVCDLGTGTCRNDPPVLDQPCGLGTVDCAAGFACNAITGGTCKAVRTAGQSCIGPGQGNCASSLVCDVSGVCRNDPPVLDQPCGLGTVDCAAGFACNALTGGTCEEARTAGQICIGLGQGNCANDLVCDVDGICRNDPPIAGQPCALGTVDCAEGLACNAIIGGQCDFPRLVGERCVGLGQGNCADDLACSVGGRCNNDPPIAGQSCNPLVRCAGNLVCDASAVCRNDPPILGEPCALGVAGVGEVKCAAGLACSDIFEGSCQPPGAAKQTCVGVGQGNCRDGLVCDGGGECRHELPRDGEMCTFPAICDPLDPVETVEVGGVTLPALSNLTCHADSIFETPRCGRARQLGEICSGVGPGSCELGLLCGLSYDHGKLEEITIGNFDLDRLVLRCEAPPVLDFAQITEDVCRGWFSPIRMHAINNQFDPKTNMSRGMTLELAAGATVSTESGTVYGPADDEHPGGRFGCYLTVCGGFEVGAGGEISACTSWTDSFPSNGDQSIQALINFNVIPGKEKGAGPSAGIAIGKGIDDGELTSTTACVFAGFGAGPPLLNYVSPSGATCTTFVRELNTTADGGLVEKAGAATDSDGDGDVAGTTCTETVSIRPKTGQLQLTWSPVVSAQSYLIRRSTTGPDSGYTTLVDGHQTTYATYLDEGLTNGDTYWYRVAPKDDQGTEFCTTAAASGTPVARTRTR